MKKLVLISTVATALVWGSYAYSAEQAATTTATPTAATTASVPAAATQTKENEGPLSKLSDSKRELVRNALQQMREQGVQLRKDIKELRDARKAILTAATFDEKAYRAKGAEMEKLHEKQQALKTDAIAKLATQLTAEERGILVDALSSGWRHHANKGKKGKEGAAEKSDDSSEDDNKE